jgi:hypothetical protein
MVQLGGVGDRVALAVKNPPLVRASKGEDVDASEARVGGEPPPPPLGVWVPPPPPPMTGAAALTLLFAPTACSVSVIGVWSDPAADRPIRYYPSGEL